MAEENTKMNGWEKARISGNVAAGVLIPVVLVWVTSIYSATEKEKDLNARYIQLAIGILRDQPKSESEQIRNWPIDVINLYSEVKLNDNVRHELLENRILDVPKDAVEFQERSGMDADGIVGPATEHQLQKDIRDMLAQDQYVAAIKLVRNVLGLGLKDAKVYVDKIRDEQ